MKYLDALFKDINDMSNETNKIRRAVWGENTWVESGEHGQIKCIYRYNNKGLIEKISVTPYDVGIDCVATDWEVYSD